MPEHSRPREKLRESGAAALTDEELVAAILGMGTAGIDVRSISRQVAALICDHREGLTLDHLLWYPAWVSQRAVRFFQPSNSLGAIY